MRPPQQREAQLAAGQPARQPQTCITASFRSPTSTQRPPKSIRHPATLDNAPNLLKIQGSNEGTAFRGDQTAGLPLKASTKKNISFFFFFLFKRRLGQGRRPLHAPCAVLVLSSHSPATLGPKRRLAQLRAVVVPVLLRGPSAQRWPARPRCRLASGLCAAMACVNLSRCHFPLARTWTVGCTDMKMPRQGQRLRVLAVAAPTPGQGAPVSRQGPSGNSSAPFCCLIRLSAAERVAWWRRGGSCWGREAGCRTGTLVRTVFSLPRVMVKAPRSLPVPNTAVGDSLAWMAGIHLPQGRKIPQQRQSGKELGIAEYI